MQNRIPCVKCSVDGELPQKRKARLTIWDSHPLQHTDDNISIVKGYMNYYLFQILIHIGMFFIVVKILPHFYIW